MIRRTIIEIFKRHGSPLAMECVAAEVGASEADVGKELSNQDKLDDLCGLSLKEAFALIEFYGPDVLFTDSITRNVTDAVLTKQKIDRIERRKRRGDKPPPASDKNS